MSVQDEVKELANQHLRHIRPSGPDNIIALCPFHEESQPSFAMSLSKGLYICYSCGAKGNLYTFLRDLGIPKQLIRLKYQLLLEAAAKNMPPEPSALSASILEENPIEESFLGLFDYCPKALLDAGFTEETLSHFDVGFDMTHMRITYPLRDMRGQLMGISGRAVQDIYPKYKTYGEEYKTWGMPHRDLDKRKVLWNLHEIYPSLYFNSVPGEVVLVEGFKACMWVWQSGIQNTVALLGNYLSWEHRLMLERLGATIYLFLDNNIWGTKGAVRAGDVLSKSTRVRVIQYPERLADEEKAQPDNLTPDELFAAKETAPDYMLVAGDMKRRIERWHTEKIQQT